MRSDTKSIQRLKIISVVCTLVSTIVSCAVIFGWLTDTLIFSQFGFSYKPMNLISAFNMLLLNLVFLFYIFRPRNNVFYYFALIIPIAVVAIAWIMLIDGLTGMHLNLEKWFLITSISLGNYAVSPISPVTLIVLILIGTALLLFFIFNENSKKMRVTAAWMLIITIVISLGNVLGYLYNAPLLVYAGGHQFTTTALPASLCAFFLAIGMISANGTRYPPLSQFAGSSLYAQFMRVLVPFIIVLFIVQAWINVFFLSSFRGYALVAAFLSVLSTIIISMLLSKLTLKITQDMDDLIHKQSSTAEQLNEALSYNRSLIEASLDPLVTINNDGKIMDVNEATIKETGVSRDQLIGSDFSQYFTDPQRANQGYKEVFKNGFVKDYELTIQSVTGNKIDVLYNASLYKNRSGAISGIFAAARDITARKKAEETTLIYAKDLERSNEELQQFAYIASHDLQEPLRVITSYLQLIERRYKDHLDQDANEFIAFAVNAAEKLQRMIMDLLAYSRVGTKGNPFSETDCNKVLKQAIDNLKVVIDETKAVIVSDDLPVLMADENQLVVVFQNLLSNAIKFRKPNQTPEIKISIEKKEHVWLFSIKDNGIGIDMQYKDKLFIIFKRLVSSQFSGNGIGLALCKRIIQRHKGQIWVDSEVNKGSTFYFTIPG
ncbi:ATP-binding protein [Legionella quateirensis]|uniref:histidine kinase n=1 Tax=Legionella quateirensis TaxID=45072 RepID=A0A378KTG7_9GAMM|nr:ATP-binding protein [Legionella quateirensis]KTD54721.1 two-component sensor histidine kinase [Legionella quateirensis]STY16901.1 two-component sensor histidine kinase [Legionella quateirensis]